MQTPSRNHICVCTRLALGLVIALTPLVCSGCYRRVIRASGPGATSIEVSEPYQEQSALDRWIYGEDERKQSGTLLNR